MKNNEEGLVLYNGKIYTQEKRLPFVSALVIKGNRMVDLGRDAIAKKYPSSRFRKIDLQKKTVLPAFCDCHAHFLGYVWTLDKVNLEQAESLSHALQLIKRFSQSKKPGEWILGYNWDANVWKESSQPDKNTLDQISTVNPMIFSARDGHQLWVNSLALKMAGIDESTGDVPGGQIGRYPDSSEPNGILKDSARKKMEDIIPRQLDASLVKKAFQNLHKKGITSIHNMENGKSLCFFQELETKGKLGLRVWQTVSKEDLDETIKIGLRTGFGSDKLKIGGVKIFADGALGSRTALMFEPYENQPDNFGLEAVPFHDLIDLVNKANRAGISAVIHAIGDKANYQALQAIKKAGDSQALRHRIEHAQIVRSEDLELFADLNVIASFQPIHCPNDYEMALKYWGNRSVSAYPLGSLLKRRVKICFGSDFPLYDFDPLLGIYAAVNRTLPESDSPAWNPSQKISVRAAVWAYTKTAAYAAAWEDRLGTLTVGKLADLVIFSGDIYQKKPEEIHRVQVVATIFDGRVVYGELG